MNHSFVNIQISDPPFTVDDLIYFQTQAKQSEIQLWEKKGCVKRDDGLWKNVDDRIALPKIAYESLISYVHGVTHVGYKSIMHYISQLFFTI